MRWLEALGLRCCLTAAISTMAVSLSGPAAYAGASVLQQRDQSFELLQAEKLPEAEAAFAELVAANPYDGRLWNNYGFSLHSQGKYEKAIDAWKKAIELGYAPDGMAYNITCACAKLGRIDEAFQWLRTAYNQGFLEDDTVRNDTDTESLRSDPRFNEIVGIFPPENATRDEKWIYDIDFLARRMEQVHFDLYGRVSRDKFQREIEKLKAEVPKLKDHQILPRLRKIVAMVGDGHTLISRPPEGPLRLGRFPIQFYVYSDGMFVRATLPEYKSLVGKKVVRIGSRSTEELLHDLRALTSVDNPMGYLDWPSVLFKCPEIVEYLGAADGIESMSVTVEDAAGKQVTQKIVPVADESEVAKQYVRSNEGTTEPLPLYLQKVQGPRDHSVLFWLHELPEHKAIYAQFNGIDNMENESFAQFCERLFRTIDDTGAKYLILDMRLNGGGNTGLAFPLIHGIVARPQINQRGHLFVVIGRETFSAAQNTIGMIEMHTEEIFVGEPSGSSPNFVGETSFITMPYCGLRVSCSSRYWQLYHSRDRRIWIPPIIAAPLSSKDFAENRDPAMDAILSEIKAQKEHDAQNPVISSR